jgi:hypothetical protein
MSGERYLVIPSAQLSDALASLDAAIANASRGTDKDRTPRLIVQVVAEVKPRQEPNVTVQRFDEEQIDG